MSILPSPSASAEARARDLEHREVPFGIERDEGSIESAPVGGVDPRVVFAGHHVRIGDDQVAAHREARAVLHPVTRHSLHLHHRPGHARCGVRREPAVGGHAGIG